MKIKCYLPIRLLSEDLTAITSNPLFLLLNSGDLAINDLVEVIIDTEEYELTGLQAVKRKGRLLDHIKWGIFYKRGIPRPESAPVEDITRLIQPDL